VSGRLCRKYWNHTIQPAGRTILSRSSQIKKKVLTTHKSVTSVAIYIYVSDKDKIAIGQMLGDTATATKLHTETAISYTEVVKSLPEGPMPNTTTN